MDFEKYLKKNAQKIDSSLDKILSQFLKDVKKTNLNLLPFAQKLVNACKGGKRIRGVLCNLGYGIAGGKGNDIYKIAAALEILHTALLIHDDIIDKSPTRRGKPSLYKSLGGNHYGISQAISIGDIGLYLPIKIISQTNFSPEYKLKALNFLSQILINTGWGQVMDIEPENSPVDYSSKDTSFVNLYKTAKYTIAGPLQIGAILAGGEDKLLKKLGDFGEKVGIAFQLQDDILDKEVKNVEKTRTKALEYVKDAKKMIPGLTKDQNMVILLEEICDYVIERRA